MKSKGSRADRGHMNGGSEESTIVLAAVIGAAILSVLYTIATLIRNRIHVHDTAVRVQELRNEYQARTNEIEAIKAAAAEKGGVVVGGGKQAHRHAA